MNPKLYVATFMEPEPGIWAAVIDHLPDMNITAYSPAALKARIASAIDAAYDKSGKLVRVVECEPFKPGKYTFVAIPTAGVALKNALAREELLKEHVALLKKAIEPFANEAVNVASYSDDDSTLLRCDVKDLRRANRALINTRHVDIDATVQMRRTAGEENTTVWRISTRDDAAIERSDRIAELEKALEPFARANNLIPKHNGDECLTNLAVKVGCVRNAARVLPRKATFSTKHINWRSVASGYEGSSSGVLLYKALEIGGMDLSGWRLFALWPGEDCGELGRFIKGPVGSSSGVSGFATLQAATIAAEQDLMGCIDQLTQAGVIADHAKQP